jgi:hypothetical protein
MSSGTSTDRGETRPGAGFEVWHFYVLFSMVAATVAVMLSQYTHPAALLLLSGSIIAAGFVGIAMHRALAGFTGQTPLVRALPPDARATLEQEKALTLRAIKELEFDRAMGKVSERDYADILGRLRARALVLMEEIDRGAPAVRRAAGAAAPAADAAGTACAACGTPHDADARFCKHCGARL